MTAFIPGLYKQFPQDRMLWKKCQTKIKCTQNSTFMLTTKAYKFMRLNKKITKSRILQDTVCHPKDGQRQKKNQHLSSVTHHMHVTWYKYSISYNTVWKESFINQPSNLTKIPTAFPDISCLTHHFFKSFHRQFTSSAQILLRCSVYDPVEVPVRPEINISYRILR